MNKTEQIIDAWESAPGNSDALRTAGSGGDDMSDKCTTHHYACACREADRAAGIASLKAQLATARSERDAATKRASDLLTRNLAQVRMVREARAERDAAVAAGRVLAEECERNRYFRKIEVQHPQVCGEAFREWIFASMKTDATPLALAWVRAAQEASE